MLRADKQKPRASLPGAFAVKPFAQCDFLDFFFLLPVSALTSASALPLMLASGAPVIGADSAGGAPSAPMAGVAGTAGVAGIAGVTPFTPTLASPTGVETLVSMPALAAGVAGTAGVAGMAGTAGAAFTAALALPLVCAMEAGAMIMAAKAMETARGVLSCVKEMPPLESTLHPARKILNRFPFCGTKR